MRKSSKLKANAMNAPLALSFPCGSSASAPVTPFFIAPSFLACPVAVCYICYELQVLVRLIHAGGKRMQKLIAGSLLALGLLAASLAGCSSDREVATEKGAVEKMTDEAARQAVDHLRIPIEKARDVRSQAEERLQGMADTAKE
jgi:hypothetical protein